MSESNQQSLWRRIAKKYAASAEELKNKVVLQGERSVTVYGCNRILEYSPREIRLSLGRRALSVTGDGLFCPSFSVGTVTVEGSISGVCFVDDGA